jgi:hypothetical protein
MLNDADFSASVAALLTRRGGAWQGTAAELLALLPGVAADATRLSVRLGEAAGELAAAGLVIERRRKAGTGARELALRLGEAQLVSGATQGPGEGVTLANGSTETATNSDIRPAEAAPILGERDMVLRRVALGEALRRAIDSARQRGV